MYFCTIGLLIVVAGELQVVVEGLAVDGLTTVSGLPQGNHTLFGGNVNKVDSHLGVLRHTDNLAEGYVLRNVAMHQVQIVPLVSPFPLQLFLHIGNHVIVLSVDGHNTAMLGHFLKDGLKVSIGHAAPKSSEDFEAGLARLHRLSYLTDGLRADLAG